MYLHSTLLKCMLICFCVQRNVWGIVRVLVYVYECLPECGTWCACVRACIMQWRETKWPALIQTMCIRAGICILFCTGILRLRARAYISMPNTRTMTSVWNCITDDGVEDAASRFFIRGRVCTFASTFWHLPICLHFRGFRYILTHTNWQACSYLCLSESDVCVYT